MEDSFSKLEVGHPMEPLCNSCRNFAFDRTVFIPWNPQGPNEDDKGRNIRVLQKLSAALANASRCLLCKKAASLFDGFCKSGNSDSFDIDPSKIDVQIDFSWVLAYGKTLRQRYGSLRMLRLGMSIGLSDRSGGHVILSACYHKCSPHPRRVDSICATPLLTDWEREGGRLYEGRLRPLTANTKLFLKWKETCNLLHGEQCRNSVSRPLLTTLRFVDARRRCIVEGQLSDSYVALSYLWGHSSPKEDLLCEATASTFYQPLSLKEGLLPATINDAITVTIALGEDLLRVDRLCIKQDDVEDKAKFVPRMHDIYGSAELTIVAAAGTDADAGLPGIRPATRSTQQNVVTFEGTAMMESLDPKWTCNVSDMSGLIGPTLYNTRAWCFQERMLCYRALIFTAEQVYWECQRATWCEEACWESLENSQVYRHCLLAGYDVLRQPWRPDPAGGVDFMFLYRMLAQQYSSRQLSNDSDSLNAFQGILETLGTGFNQQFYWALPLVFFELALAWPTKSDVRRNHAQHFQPGTDGTITGIPFPSWSWVGWSGAKGIAGLDSWKRRSQTFVFYRLDEYGELVDVYHGGLEIPLDNGETLRTERENEPTSTEEKSIPSWFDTSKTLFTKNLIPEHVISSPLAKSVLCFWTSCASLLIKSKDVLKQDGKSVFFKWRQYPTPKPGLYEFAVICCETCHDDVENNLVRALCLYWENGVAFRVGQISIAVSEWGTLKTIWKSIVLG